MGATRNEDERLDRAWVKEQAEAAIAARPAHRSMPLEVGGGWFRAWCTTEGKFVSAKGRDKARMTYLAGAHERANNVEKGA
jgi:hypothetical protein